MIIDVLIIGAGPAGLSAAIYAERAGKHAVCFEALTVGGQIVNTPEIANYPGIKKTNGFDFSMALYEQATELGAKVIYEPVGMVSHISDYSPDALKALGIDENDPELKDCFITCTGGGKHGAFYPSRTVIIATGAKNRHLGLDKEEELTGHGVSYCATCDGAFFKGKDVAVNGGGDVALEDALFLSNYCNKVYVIHRRNEFRGEQKSVDALKNKTNIEFVLDSTVEELKGDKALEGIVVKNKNTGELRDIDVQGLFIAIGQEPDNKMRDNIVDLDDKGYIVADESCKTRTPGVFVAGDCRTKEIRQLTTAAADGAVAALMACSYIG